MGDSLKHLSFDHEVCASVGWLQMNSLHLRHEEWNIWTNKQINDKSTALWGRREIKKKEKKDVDVMLWQNRSPIESYSTFFIPLLKRQPILYAYHGIKFKTDIIYLLYSHFLLMTIENCLSVSFYPFHLSHPFSFHFHLLLQQEICGCADNKTNVHKWHVKSMSTGNCCSNNIFKKFIYRPWTRVSSWDPYNISVSFLKDNIIL